MNWAAVVLWSGIIFYLSSLSHLGINPATELVSMAAHAVEYAVLTILLTRALGGDKSTVRRGASMAALLALAFAGSDEYHQSFVANRDPSVFDLMVDAAAIGAVAIVTIARARTEG